jgi:hypothetical protein
MGDAFISNAVYQKFFIHLREEEIHNHEQTLENKIKIRGICCFTVGIGH